MMMNALELHLSCYVDAANRVFLRGTESMSGDTSTYEEPRYGFLNSITSAEFNCGSRDTPSEEGRMTHTYQEKESRDGGGIR